LLKSRFKLFSTHTESTLGGYMTTDGVAASGTTTYYSNKMIPAGDVIGFRLKTTGTLTGTFTLWYSDKDHPSLADDTDWDQDPNWSPTNPAGGVTSKKYAVDGVETAWARIKYVNASGTGTVYGYQSRDNGGG
jgi:hypothetical protein